MKTASKVFLIIDLVWRGLYIFSGVLGLFAALMVTIGSTGFWAGFWQGWAESVGVGLGVAGIATIIFLILIFAPGVVFDIIALKKLNHAICKTDVPTGICVCVLIFSNLLAGIFMLCLSDKDFIPTTVSQTVYYQNIPPVQPMNGYYQGMPNGNPNTYQNPYPNSNPNAYQNPYPNGNPNAYQNPYPNGNPNAYRNPYPNGNPNAYRNPYPNGNQNTPVNPAPNPNHNPSAGATDTNSNHNTHPDQQ